MKFNLFSFKNYLIEKKGQSSGTLGEGLRYFLKKIVNQIKNDHHLGPLGINGHLFRNPRLNYPSEMGSLSLVPKELNTLKVLNTYFNF